MANRVYKILTPDASPLRLLQGGNRVALPAVAGVMLAALLALAALLLGPDTASSQSAPAVTGVAVSSTPSADQTYALGETIQVTLTFGEAADVTGTPRLKIDMDPADWGEKWANYERGSGTASLTFAHTVVEPNISTQGIAVLADTLELNGGAIQSSSGENADLSHEGLGHNTNHKVDWQVQRAEEESEPPARPTGLVVSTETGALEVSLDWNDVEGADEYLVRWRQHGEGQELNDGVRTETSGAEISMDDYGKWVVRVEACNDGGCGPGLSRTVWLRQSKPERPQNLAVSVSPGKLGAAASWDAVERATSYKLRWRRPNGGFASGDLVSTTATSADITVSAHGEWVVRVEGCNDAGCGPGAAKLVSVEQPNRAPMVNDQSDEYASFMEAGWAPRGIMVSKLYEGIFSDPDGDTLTYTVSVPDDRSQLVDSVSVEENTRRVFILLDADDDWGTITPALADPLVTTVTLTATDPEGLSASITGDFQTNWASEPALKRSKAVGAAIVLTFNQELQESPKPGTDQFTVNVVNDDGTTGTITVEDFRVRGNVATLWLASTPGDGQTITLDYAHEDATPLKRASDGGDTVPGFTGNAVSFESDDAVPAQPLGLKAASSWPGVAIGWDKVPGATSYSFDWRQAGTNLAWENEGLDQACPDDFGYWCYAQFFVTSHGDWEARLAACNSAGCSAYITKAFTVAPPRPATVKSPPENLKIYFSSSQLTRNLTWGATPNAASYRLSWQKDGEEPRPEDVATVNETSTNVTVSEAGEWTISLQGCNNVGCGPSVTRTVDFSLTDPPEILGNLNVSVTPGSLDITATWDSVPTATSYNLSRHSVQRRFLNENEVTVTEPTATISLPAYGRWVLRLEACNAGGCGPTVSVRARVASSQAAMALACERSESVRDALVASVGKPCDAITIDDLANVTSLEIAGFFSQDGIQPWDLEDLSGLETLKLQGTLRTLPVDVFDDLTSLRTLDLNTSLTTLPAGVFANLSSLESLDLSNNWLTSLPEGVFDGLSGLETLDLGHNRGLDSDLSTLPAGVFANLSSLESLDLSYNWLTSLPEGVFDGLSSLESLDLGGHGMTALPSSAFQGLTNLEYLSVSGSKLTSLPADAFDGLSSLQTLQLSGTDLTTLPAGVFDGLSNLDTLNMQSNGEVTSLPAGVFDGLSNLRQLNMWLNTSLTTLPAGVFDDLSNLELLYLDGAELSSLPEGVFDGLSSLEDMDLSGNKLTTLREDAFKDLASLWALRLHDNRLTALPEEVFDGTPNLLWLTLQDNELDSLSADMFNELSMLTTLGVSGNPGHPFGLNLRAGITVKDYICKDAATGAFMKHDGSPLLDADGNVMINEWIFNGPTAFCKRNNSPLWDSLDAD